MILDKLDYILAVAEEQNLTRAAKKLFISQPALTNYINKLEDELGVKLFDRTVTPVRVTEAGALYIEKMKRIRQASDSLFSQLRQLGSRQTLFRLGIGSTRGNHWLPLMLPSFCRRHPDITLQLYERGEDSLEKLVRTGEIDVAFGVLNTSYPELEYVEIASEKVLLAIPREFPCVSHLSSAEATPGNPHPITREEIGSIPFLLPYPGNGFYNTAVKLMGQLGLVAQNTITYGNMNTAYRLAGEGLGALFITPAFFTTQDPCSTKKLAFCSLHTPGDTRRAVAGFRKDNCHMELIQDIIAAVRETVVPALEKMP